MVRNPEYVYRFRAQHLSGSIGIDLRADTNPPLRCFGGLGLSPGERRIFRAHWPKNFIYMKKPFCRGEQSIGVSVGMGAVTGVASGNIGLWIAVGVAIDTAIGVTRSQSG